MENSGRTKVDDFFLMMDYLLGPAVYFAIFWGVTSLLFPDDWGDPLLWASALVMAYLSQIAFDGIGSNFPIDHRPNTTTQATTKLVAMVVYCILVAAVLGLSLRDHFSPLMAAALPVVFLLAVLPKSVQQHRVDLEQLTD